MKKLIIIILLLLCLTANVSHSQSFKMFGQLLNPHWSSEGLVFYWRGIEAVEVVDESRYGNAGTITGPTWVGDGLLLDGTNDEIRIADNSIFTPVVGITVIANLVVHTAPSVGETEGIVSHYIGDGNQRSWAISITEDLKVQVSASSDGFFDATLSVADSDAITLGERITVALRWVAGGKIELWVNAVKKAESPGTTASLHDSIADVFVGNQFLDPGTADFIINATFHGVSIYNRALSASEIAALTLKPDLPMQQPPIWLLQPSVVVGGIRHIIDGGIGPSIFGGSVVR